MKKKYVIGIVVLSILLIVGGALYLNTSSEEVYPNMDSGDEVCPLPKEDESADKKEVKKKTTPTKVKVGYQVGERIPNLKLTKADGSVENLYDLIEGKEKFILNLSADWCSDSQREKDKLNKVYKDLVSDKVGVAVVYVNLSKDDSTKQTDINQIKSYIKDSNFTFPTFVDQNDELLNKFNITSVPTNIVLDKNGIIKGHTEEIDMDNLLLDNSDDFKLE